MFAAAVSLFCLCHSFVILQVGNSSWTPFSADHTLSADRLTLAIPSIHHADDGMYAVHLGNLFGPIYVNFTITHEGTCKYKRQYHE